MNEQTWSVSDADVLASIRDLRNDDRPAVVATVVDVVGSAYRRPGARMLVEPGGQGLGHITAGCLEDEVFELAADILDAGEPRVETYDLMETDDDVWGLGIGCNGIIDVLIEPLDESYTPLITAFETDEPIAIITIIDGDASLGAKAYYRDGRVEIASDGFPEWAVEPVGEPAATLLETGKADSVTIKDGTKQVTVFVDGVRPTPRLVIFGTGHDVGPVVELGKRNGFRVSVVGFRGGVDLTQRFPDADAHVSTSPVRLSDDVALDERTYAVVMTHNFIDDRLALDELLSSSAPYVGLLGPRDRFEEMMDEFEAEGRTFSSEELRRVYTPIGLDLGAGSPYGISTSIIAEILAVHNDRIPAHLKEREGPIHDRIEVESPSSP